MPGKWLAGPGCAAEAQGGRVGWETRVSISVHLRLRPVLLNSDRESAPEAPPAQSQVAGGARCRLSVTGRVAVARRLTLRANEQKHMLTLGVFPLHGGLLFYDCLHSMH